MASDLVPVEFEGGTAWVADAAVPDEPPAGVRLLPYFDAYLIGSHPRAKLFPGPAATRALSPSGQAGNFPVVLVDGVVAGVWHQKRSGRSIAITVELLGRSTASLRRRVEAEGERIAHILEGTPKLTSDRSRSADTPEGSAVRRAPEGQRTPGRGRRADSGH